MSWKCESRGPARDARLSEFVHAGSLNSSENSLQHTPIQAVRRKREQTVRVQVFEGDTAFTIFGGPYRPDFTLDVAVPFVDAPLRALRINALTNTRIIMEVEGTQ